MILFQVMDFGENVIAVLFMLSFTVENYEINIFFDLIDIAFFWGGM